MAHANDMTDLLNKIERRIGTKMLHLPDNLSKDTWVEVIDGDTFPIVPAVASVIVAPNEPTKAEMVVVIV